MRINAFSDVSLRVLMVLSTERELLTTRTIADAVGTPYNHVSKAVLKLRQMGLVEAVRGRAGGVRISDAGLAATVGGVLRILDDRQDVADCQTDMGDCPLAHGCGLRGALTLAREAFYASLDNVTVASLVRAPSPEPVEVTLLTSRLA
ncbi:Rrf2 family transcriptional regulator [Arthrobacter livingstonensis]|uniref:Rrf2 family transcriptional regulator n=1 Tax=Arthrobacter livingstonensis TaxID=670078 RepID=A0A2V5M057_9MICC|nr:Rrf2 family transcriptional regulator [Arthrobacter livingstonensis]PYI69857.1 Rrf2 family transcriptional regulator [Arthrobacter livingstonensis]